MPIVSQFERVRCNKCEEYMKRVKIVDVVHVEGEKSDEIWICEEHGKQNKGFKFNLDY